jgi:hypothetical protein
MSVTEAMEFTWKSVKSLEIRNITFFGPDPKWVLVESCIEPTPNFFRTLSS